MAEDLKPLDISQIAEVRRLVEEVLEAERPRVLQIDDEKAAVLIPGAGKRASHGRTTSEDDPLWNIVGLAQSDGPGDVAENVDRYLAQAYAPREA